MGVLTHGLFIWNEDEDGGTEMSATGYKRKSINRFLPYKLEA